MAFVARALPALRVAGLMMGVSLVAAAGVGYWFFVSQQRDYIVGRDFRLLSNLTRQVDNAARAEARVIQNLPKQPRGKSIDSDSRTLPGTWSNFRGKPYQPSDITFEKKKLLSYSARPDYTFRVSSHLILDVPVPARSAGGDVLTASLNLQRGLESLFNSRVGPSGFDAILLGTRDGRVLVSAGLRRSSSAPVGSTCCRRRQPKPISLLSSKSSRKPLRWRRSPSLGSTTRSSSLRVACRRTHRRIDSSLRDSCAATHSRQAAGPFRRRSSRCPCSRC